ncbi:DUF4815 domain-containing protein [Brevibacillus dissolubilis]|uniref:DUF4815 domain-containing protein n=1 Tax=Brevibacillus dissolubilis TaxID=1844116 RepID=UPI0011179EA3|nr:DUF4815 domain-containing protein [Brevibacillus dissolubilis]
MATYYNRFDPKKRWVSVQAVGGRRLQSAELNEMQSLSLYRDKQLGDVIFGSGHIIEGGQLYINTTKTSLKISPARVYLEGIIHEIPETTLTITGHGAEVIGLTVEYRNISFEDDPTLYDPAVGYDNHGMPGADRMVADPKWLVNDPDATMMYRLEDGILVTSKLPPELEGFTPVLARRTYDTSGNFLVSGMDGFIEHGAGQDEEHVTLVVDAGRAYVQGFEINKLVPMRIQIEKALDTQSVINEPKTYDKDVSKYELSFQPVSRLGQVSALVEVTENVMRGMGSLMDLLPKNPVLEIVSVTTGSTVYVKNRDYKLTSNHVDWTPADTGSMEPIANTSYQVTYRYNKLLVFGRDITLENGMLTFLDLGEKKPVHGCTITVDYDFYLPRKDVYYLTADGEIKVIQGQSGLYPPTPASPPDVLELGEIFLPANSDHAIVTNRKPKRLTMLELRSLLDRLERAEYNQALSDLDRAAQYTDPTVQKKGIFTDNFTNFERSDVTHPGFDAMFDPVEKTLQLPMTQKLSELTVDGEKSTVRIHERLMTIGYEEEVLIDQPFATEAMNINPYQVFGNLATIRLIPSHDIWVEQFFVTQVIWGWWLEWWNNGRTVTRMILDEQIPFIRVRDVAVIGEGFEPFSDNIMATFDGKPVVLTPLDAGTTAGTQKGTVRADGLGRLTCKFTIPAGIRAGTREVRFWNES